MHYRDDWYLDAWCHLRNDIRVFALDAIRVAVPLSTAARNIAEDRIDEAVAGGYGIFAGQPKDIAVLRFTPESARWVAGEKWHPHQEGEYDERGYYILKIPYSDFRELLMDVLRHGSDVEVLQPATLRRELKHRISKMIEMYV